MERIRVKYGKRYLFLPYEHHMADQKVRIFCHREEVLSFYYPLARDQVDGWIGCTLPDSVFGKEVEIISEENPMIKAVYAADSVCGGTEEPGVLPWIHFHAPSGKILDVKAFFQEENGEWHISLLEDFSMGPTENEGRLREYRSKDLYLWEAKSQNGKGYGRICRAEGTPWVGDVQRFFYAENKNGEKIGFALSRFFSSENLPVNHVLSIPVKYMQSTAKRKNGKIEPVEALKNLRIWKRDWYLQRIEKEFCFVCRFRIAPGEWPGVTIKEKDGTLDDIRAEVIEAELELQVGMEENIRIELAGLSWTWSALTQELKCKEYRMPAEARNGRLKLHFFCDHVVQEAFSESGEGMLITFLDRIKEVHVIQNDEIENIQNPTFRLQYAPDPYIKIQTVGTTASIVELHVYALRRPDYAPENKEQLQNIMEGNGLYRSAQFTVYENAVEDAVYGAPKAWVTDGGRRVFSPVRVTEDFQWAPTPWGDMTRVIHRKEVWDFQGYGEFPQLETGIPTVNAAYNLAVDILQKNLSTEYALPGNEGLLNAGLLQGKGEGFGVWVRDTCHNAFRIADFLIPDSMRRSLVHITRHGFDNGSDAAAMPPIAVWDYYLATADRSILFETYSALQGFVEKADALYEEKKGLMRAAHSAAQDAFLEEWNGGYSLSPQVYYAQMYQNMADICGEINKDAEKNRKYRQRGEQILNNVREMYWNKEKRCFTSGPAGSEAYRKGIWEATGAEVCIWPRFGVADRRQREEFLRTIKTQEHALNDFGLNWYPFAKGKNHFWNTCWVSWTEGIAVAAGRTGDMELLRKLIFQQVRNVVLHKTFHEAVDFSTGRAWRWPGLTWHASAFLGYFIFGLLGIAYEKDRIRFTPCIPPEFSHMKLYNLKYRNAVFEIEVQGEGNRFALYIDDSKAEDIPGDITGAHRISLSQEH